MELKLATIFLLSCLVFTTSPSPPAVDGFPIPVCVCCLFIFLKFVLLLMGAINNTNLFVIHFFSALFCFVFDSIESEREEKK